MGDSPFMLRPVARAAPPGFPPDVAPNQIIYASHINAIRNSVAVWPGNVDGNTKTLSNVGQIGIGTATPFNPLQVKTAANQHLAIRQSGGASVGIGAINDAGSAVAPMVFEAGLFTFTGGNVGIGGSPQAALHVRIASASVAEVLRIDNSSGAGSNGALINWSNADQLYAAGGIGFVRQEGGGVRQDFVFYLTSNWTTTAPAEKIRLTGNGDVGIGTIAPAARLHATDTFILGGGYVAESAIPAGHFSIQIDEVNSRLYFRIKTPGGVDKAVLLPFV